jgi:haloalkane dehalogenase
LAFRESGPEDGPVALLLHGFPESSHMWRGLMPALAAAGWRAVAPDFPGFGDSEPEPPHTWERYVQWVERFRRDLELDSVALVVHDWGGMIGLAWACEHPEAVSAMVISSTGFFPDGRWHGLAEMARTPGEGEQMMEGMTRDGLGALLREQCPAMDEETIDEYWKCFGDERRRRGHLEFWRSMDFDKLAPHDGKLAEMGKPTLILWGETDPFAFVPGAHRFHKEIPDSRLVLVEGGGHFVWEDEPERTAREVVEFLS